MRRARHPRILGRGPRGLPDGCRGWGGDEQPEAEMTERETTETGGAGGDEAPLLEIDARLNVYALANGLDLLKNASGAPDRTLEWYRDGMERRIRIVATGGAPAPLALRAGAARSRGGRRRETWVPVRDGITPGEIMDDPTGILEDAIRRADALTRDDLPPHDPPPDPPP